MGEEIETMRAEVDRLKADLAAVVAALGDWMDGSDGDTVRQYTPAGAVLALLAHVDRLTEARDEARAESDRLVQDLIVSDRLASDYQEQTMAGYRVEVTLRARAEKAERERDTLSAQLDAMTNQAIMLSGRRATIVDVGASDEVAVLRERVAVLEAAIDDPSRELVRDLHRDDGGDSGHPGEVVAWIRRLEAARKGGG